MIPRFPPTWAEVFGEDKYGIFAECSFQNVKFIWRWICPGHFKMGCDPGDSHGLDGEKPQHNVTLTQGFWLGETPVTQAQWMAVMGHNPSHFKEDQRPVEQVNWHQCRDFAVKLNTHFPGLHATLPTEAQWEYACRAGNQAAFHDGSACTNPFGKDPALDRLGWFDANSEGRTHTVKEKNAPNAWGLHDMHGNVWEWCLDGKRDYSKADQTDPLGPTDDRAWRVVRGGSWIDHAWFCRAAYRSRGGPVDRWINLGFRLAAGQELGGGAAGHGVPE